MIEKQGQVVIQQEKKREMKTDKQTNLIEKQGQSCHKTARNRET